jgi:hypothetical protein
MPMARLSALVGMSFLMALAAGCGGGDDTISEPPIDINVQLATVTKERDAAQAELKKEREAEVSQLARSESAEAAAATGIDELKRQLHTVRNQLAEAQKELEKARKEAADLKGGGAQGEHAAKEGDAAGKNEHSGTATAPVAQRTHDQELAARDFRCDEVSFQTTLPEFKKLYPSIQGQVAKAGESSYQFNSKSGAAVVATFLDDQLLSIQLRYTEQQLKELGGWDTLNKRLQTEVGEPDSADDHVARWSFDSADRMIMASGRNGGAAVVTITRKSLVEERNHRLEKLGAGL